MKFAYYQSEIYSFFTNYSKLSVQNDELRKDLDLFVETSEQKRRQMQQSIDNAAKQKECLQNELDKHNKKVSELQSALSNMNDKIQAKSAETELITKETILRESEIKSIQCSIESTNKEIFELKTIISTNKRALKEKEALKSNIVNSVDVETCRLQSFQQREIEIQESVNKYENSLKLAVQQNQSVKDQIAIFNEGVSF